MKYNYKYKETFFGCKCIKDKIGVDIFFFKNDGNGKIIYVSERAKKSGQISIIIIMILYILKNHIFMVIVITLVEIQ